MTFRGGHTGGVSTSTDVPTMALSWKQRLGAAAALSVAFAALVGAILTGGESSDTGVVMSQSPVDGGGTRDGEAVPLVVDPVQGWFPAAGEGSACSEPVGVDLLQGYSAILTINGVEIPIEDTNVYGADGRTLTAGGSQGQVTWGPEPDCPFGELLRPTGNTVSACVYRLVDGPETCRVFTRPDAFDF